MGPSPNEIARRTLRLLSTRRIAPTPENYRDLYSEVAGGAPRETVAANDGPAEGAVEARELLAETLELGVAARLIELPELAAEATELARRLRTPAPAALSGLRKQLRSLWLKIETHGPARGELQEGLLRVLHLLVDNIGELVVDDEPLHGQIAAVQQAISHPLNSEAIALAEKNLRNVVFKQSLLKQGLHEARALLKQMVASFVDQLGQLSESTGDYHDTMENLAQQLRQTEDMGRLKELVDEVMRETRNVQASTLRAREEVLATRRQIDAAEHRIRDLEAGLVQASAKAREDHLTGTLNRQGLSEAFEREVASVQRHGKTLSVALLDIDNLCEFNETYGHQAHDDALAHLASVIKETARPADAVARFRDDQFLILLPDAAVAPAVEAMVRLQRELTRRFFLHNKDRLLLTFSAGVASYTAGESQAALMQRVERALHRAKRAGKNQVASAE